MPQTVLVTGATGFIGQAVVRALLDEGHRVRALTRIESHWPFPDHPNLERVTGDIRARSSVIAACTGIDAIVHLAAAKNDEAESEDSNVGGARNIIEAAREAKVGRIVNMSTQSARIPKKGIYGTTKEKADALFMNAGVPVVTLRSSLVYGDRESGVFGAIVRFSGLPVIPIFGHARFRPIHREDLAVIVAKALRLPGVVGNVYDVGGPDSLSLDELTRAVMEARGIYRPIMHLPVWFGLLVARLCSVLPHPPLTVSNVLGGATDVSMDTEKMQRDFAFFSFRSIRSDLTRLFGKPEDKARKEAGLLLTYVLSAMQRYQPSAQDIDRTLDAWKRHGQTSDLHISSLRMLCVLDAATRLRYPQCVLQKKLLIAAAIAETQPQSAPALLPRERSRSGFACECIRLSLRSLAAYMCAVPLFLFPSYLARHAGIL